jgi:hypothetical protein
VLPIFKTRRAEYVAQIRKTEHAYKILDGKPQ